MFINNMQGFLLCVCVWGGGRVDFVFWGEHCVEYHYLHIKWNFTGGLGWGGGVANFFVVGGGTPPNQTPRKP